MRKTYNYGNLLDAAVPLQQKLDFLIKHLNLKNDTDLANKIGVNQSTISRWRTGSATPNSIQAIKLNRLYRSFMWGTDKLNKKAFLASNTLVFDEAKELYDAILDVYEPLSTSTAIHSICVKIAAIAEQFNSERQKLKGTLVTTLSQVYNAKDLGEFINFKLLKTNGAFSTRAVDSFVRVGKINDKFEFIYQIECINNGNVELKKAGLITDINIQYIAATIIKFLNKKD